MNNKIIIDNSKEYKRFTKHITPIENRNILFSGQFGIGKTYFIDDFFKKKKDQYITITLNPVNYSVSPNEDIFEYIKYDIAFQLFKHQPEFEKLEINKENFAPVFLENNFKSIVKTLGENLSKIDRRISTVYKSISDLSKHLEEERLKLEIDEEGDLEKFLSDFNLSKGTIYEVNGVSQLINKLLNTLKTEDENSQELVLIIDDLDRIDPEHIFRILNVFSSHINFTEDQSKFDFDKTILIGDVENLRNIFHAKYGSSTDFSGYIDKFYSVGIFHFDNKEQLAGYIIEFLRKIKTQDIKIRQYFNENNITNSLLISILEEMVVSGSINLRKFIHISKMEYENIRNIDFKIGNTQVSHENPIIFIILFLVKFSGGFKELIDNFKKTRAKFPLDNMGYYDDFEASSLYGNIAMLLDYRNNKFMPNNEHSCLLPKYDLEITYTIQSLDYSKFANAETIKRIKSKNPVPDPSALKKNQAKFQIDSIPKYDLLIEVAEVINLYR